MTRAFLAGLVFGLVAVPALAEPPPEPEEERAAAVAAAQDDADDDAPVVDYTFRLAGGSSTTSPTSGDVTVQRLSVWSDFRIGDRVQARASYDVGATRIHDLYVQYDLGGGVRLRAGRSARSGWPSTPMLPSPSR